MKTPTDISSRQFTANHRTTADGEKRHLQHVDFQRLFSYKNALTFTGKEKDSLRLNPQSGGLCGARLTTPPDLFTRFYYFGARYYDPSLSGLFLSVDPMADKYPSISPYAYCAWNPVKLVDPEGREFGDIYNLRGQHIGSDGRNDNVVYLKSSLSQWEVSDLQDVFCYNRAKELIGKTNIATPIGSLLKKK